MKVTLRQSVGAALVALAGAAAAAGPPSPDARAVLEHVRATGDNAGMPFVVIDKKRARLWLHDASGRSVGDAPVLLGYARGDHTAPGVADKPLSKVRPHERTTPAGRFVAEHGRNLQGHDILWIDYEAAVSMHRVREVHASERRLQRLASRSAADNRISYGCINVPVAFYDRSLMPLVGRGKLVVYLLPETRPVTTLFAKEPMAWPTPTTRSARSSPSATS